MGLRSSVVPLQYCVRIPLKYLLAFSITEAVIIHPVLTDLPEQALTGQPAEEYYS